jgi:hypothetical protein
VSWQKKKWREEINIIQVFIGVLFAALLGMIIPALLDSKSDLAVMVGVCIVISMFYFIVKNGPKITDFFINLGKEKE